jgi:hypothetical protein
MNGERQRLRSVLDVCAKHLAGGEARLKVTSQAKGILGLEKNDKDGAFFILETLDASENINDTLL